MAAAQRWRRLRRDWLRGAVCISSDAAVVAVTPNTSEGARRCHRSVWTLLRDDRMLAHDDGEGRPLRYLSWYGGIVTSML